MISFILQILIIYINIISCKRMLNMIFFIHSIKHFLLNRSIINDIRLNRMNFINRSIININISITSININIFIDIILTNHSILSNHLSTSNIIISINIFINISISSINILFSINNFMFSSMMINILFGSNNFFALSTTIHKHC